MIVIECVAESCGYENVMMKRLRGIAGLDLQCLIVRMERMEMYSIVAVRVWYVIRYAT